MPENDKPLSEFAIFSMAEGLQNEVSIVPETIKREPWREKEPESREEDDFGGKSRISSILYAFQGGSRS